MLLLLSKTFTDEETDHHLSLILTFSMREPYIAACINNIYDTKKRTFICRLYQYLRYEGTIYCHLYQQHLRDEETDHHLSLTSTFTEWCEPYIFACINNIYGTKKRTFICRLYQNLRYEGTIYCRLYQQHFRHEETDHHLSLILKFTVWGNYILSLVSTTFTARRNRRSFVA